ELGDDADPHGNLVGGEDLLALDGELTLPHVNQDDVDGGLAARPPVPARQRVPPGIEHLVEPTVDVAQAPMRAPDHDLATPSHGAHLPRSRQGRFGRARLRQTPASAALTQGGPGADPM